MEKICIQCGAAFEAKRSDAVYCSTECRNSANYAKKRVENIDDHPLQVKSLSSSSPTVAVGHLDQDDVKECIASLTIQINEKIQTREFVNNSIDELLATIMEKESDKLKISENVILNLEGTLQLSECKIYNDFLNEEYLEDLKKGDKYAHHHLKSERDFERSYLGDIDAINSVINYQNKLRSELHFENLKIARIDDDVALLNSRIDNHNNEVKSLKEDLRFLQSRLTRYDHLLTGAK